MNIKTRLEDDPILFKQIIKNQSKIMRINNLNDNGIFTIEDFINCRETDFPSNCAKMYCSMINIYKEAYLDQVLVYDTILRKEYKCDTRGFRNCGKDLATIGIQGYTNAPAIHKAISSKTDNKQDYFKMKDVLKGILLYPGLPNAIRCYYLKYMESEKFKSNSSPIIQIDDSISTEDNLSKLIEEVYQIIETLKLTNDNNTLTSEILDKLVDRITKLEERVSVLEENQKKYIKQ